MSFSELIHEIDNEWALNTHVIVADGSHTFRKETDAAVIGMNQLSQRSMKWEGGGVKEGSSSQLLQNGG